MRKSYVDQATLLLLLAIVISITKLCHGSSSTSAINGGRSGGGEGIRWAVLVAGSYGYENYRHQANVCHAYQIMRKGGLKEANIIVFMYDDIAFNEDNPRPGIIINRPNGPDVYAGVPKDYTGKNAEVNNLFAAIMGNKSALNGGSGKVVSSGPNDHIFIYYADHGAPGYVAMPSGDDLYAKDLITVLEEEHKTKSYKSMVIYVEACESGSMFEGLLSSNFSIYAVTASNASEFSYGTYCPGMDPSPPPGYGTCLGDLFSVSWMEDTDRHDSSKETLKHQYKVVMKRTGFSNPFFRSHVMKYGDVELSEEVLSVYIGANGEKKNASVFSSDSARTPRVLNQCDASLLYFQEKLRRAPEGSEQKKKAEEELGSVMSHMEHVDRSIEQIANIVAANYNTAKETLMKTVRPSMQPVVDDWDCLKMMLKVYEKHCGSLSWYGKSKYMRVMANMCNAGVSIEQINLATIQACYVNINA